MKTATEMKAIMTRAHMMTRDIISKEPELDYRATFAAALKIAHAESGKTAFEIWTSYSGKQQYDYLLKMTGYEYRTDNCRINKKTGQAVPPVFEWLRDSKLDIAEELRAVAHTAYITVAETFIREPETDRPLGQIVSRAVKNAAQRQNRAEHRNARAIREHTDPETGETRSIIDTKAGAAAAHLDSPEAAAVLTDLIDRACKDRADRLVIADRIAGYTQTETAELLSIGQRAVAKRLDGIRDRLAETIGRDPREKKAPRGRTAKK